VIPHELAVRVYYEDTDAAGIVYHANYLKFAERGRTELLRSLGFDHRRLAQAHGLVFAVARCAIDFMRPARLDDLLHVRTEVAGRVAQGWSSCRRSCAPAIRPPVFG
jgi:acyl-CoA thioester hydrolase